MGFTVVGLGTYSREFAREVREAAARYGVEALITDDYLEVEEAHRRGRARAGARHADGAPHRQAPRHRLRGDLRADPRAGRPGALQPGMGFEGANVIFDTWVHPLMMGLEEHLLQMFRDDFEFHDRRRGLAPAAVARRSRSRRPRPPGCTAARRPRRGRRPADARRRRAWTPDGENGAQKIPFFVRGKARRNTERFARSAASPRSPWRRSTMRKRTSAADADAGARRHRDDGHATCRAPPSGRARALVRELPGLELSRARRRASGANDPAALARCRDDIARGDIVVATMLFMEDHFLPVLAALAARAATACDAMVCCMSAGEVTRLTRMGRFGMSGTAGRRRWRCSSACAARAARSGTAPARSRWRCCGGSRRSCASSRAPRRTCARTSSRCSTGSAARSDNVANLVRFLVERYATVRAARCAGAHGPARRSSTRTTASTIRASGAHRRRRLRAAARTGDAAAPWACYCCAPTCSPATPPTTTA